MPIMLASKYKWDHIKLNMAEAGIGVQVEPPSVFDRSNSQGYEIDYLMQSISEDSELEMERNLSDDIDTVMEQISDIIKDMENDLSETAEPTHVERRVKTLSVLGRNLHPDSTISLSAPSIHELYPDQRDSRSSFNETMDAKNMPDETINRDAPTDFNRPIKPNKSSPGRMYVSAGNSPVLSRKMVSKSYSDNLDKRCNHTKLLIPNMDKFDIEITCPDGEIFKAAVFKVWTASQLSWKIAHIKGMREKLALVVQEYITQLHLVRPIEDHECVYDIIQNWAPGSFNALQMVEDFSKFDIFNEPAESLPVEMLDVSYADKLLKGPDSTKHSLFSFIVKADTAVDVHHWVFVKDFDKKTWKRMYLRIKDSILYLCDNKEQVFEEWTLLYKCKEAYLYYCLEEFQTAHKPPHKNGFCIIPAVVNKWKQIKCFSIESERVYLGWITGFRLAKYGQQLFMNFCEAMTKEENLCRTHSSRQRLFRVQRLSESGPPADSKATVDFSGDNARVISDPLEKLQIQNQLGFEIPRPPKRRSETFSPMAFRRAVLSNKVWYHGKVKREQAILKLNRNGMKEGMFLVRESSTCQGNLVLSVVRKGKIAHHQIFQESTPEGKPLYGVQHGPQFSDLELFIEAYNSGTIEGADFILRKPCPVT